MGTTSSMRLSPVTSTRSSVQKVSGSCGAIGFIEPIIWSITCSPIAAAPVAARSCRMSFSKAGSIGAAAGAAGAATGAGGGGAGFFAWAGAAIKKSARRVLLTTGGLRRRGM